MSAENQVTPSTEAAVTDAGPQEIVFAHQTLSKEPAPQADVIDVEVKEPATTEPAKTEPEPEKAGDKDESRDEKGRFKGGLQDRIDDLTRARREAERNAAYWEARARGASDATQNPAQPAALTPPKPDDFPTTEAFNEALIDYKVATKLDENLKRQQAEQKAHTEVSERVQSWQARLTEAREAIPDFNEALEASNVMIAPHVSDLLIDHEDGAKLLHHFALNPELGTKLNGMTITKAANELAKIAAGLSPAAPAPKAPPVKQASAAPAPITPLGQGRTTSPSVEDMEMDDYVKLRKSQGASWAR